MAPFLKLELRDRVAETKFRRCEYAPAIRGFILHCGDTRGPPSAGCVDYLFLLRGQINLLPENIMPEPTSEDRASKSSERFAGPGYGAERVENPFPLAKQRRQRTSR
jgi:hypothetical protein